MSNQRCSKQYCGQFKMKMFDTGSSDALYDQLCEKQTREKSAIQCFRKQNLGMRTGRSKALQLGKRDLLNKMRPKCGPIFELLRTQE